MGIKNILEKHLEDFRNSPDLPRQKNFPSNFTVDDVYEIIETSLEDNTIKQELTNILSSSSSGGSVYPVINGENYKLSIKKIGSDNFITQFTPYNP